MEQEQQGSPKLQPETQEKINKLMAEWRAGRESRITQETESVADPVKAAAIRAINGHYPTTIDPSDPRNWDTES